MIVEPKFRGFICTTSHPTGCKKNVENQIEYVKENGKIDQFTNDAIELVPYQKKEE